MTLLSINYKNLKFINPFLLASSPVTRNGEMILRAFKSGWAGAVTKTICLEPEKIHNAGPRLQSYKSNSGIIGLNNIELISERPLNIWLDEIKHIKDKYPDRILIASIMAEAYNKSGWQELSSLVQDAGADIIELNISCPHGMPERGMGSFCSEIPQVCADITKSVKEVSQIPVWAKLSPNVTDISYLAQSCLEAGADGIVAINTVKGFSGIDIETLNPRLNINGQSAYGGFSGQLVKPIALKAVSEIATNNNCFISATGGISNWQDSIEFMLLGASTLQICTEVMLNGYEIINGLTSNLEDYLKKHNFNSIEEIIGLSLDKITSFKNLNKQQKALPQISYEECNNCGKCLVSCRDGAYQAIEYSYSDDMHTINKEKCDSCGLCTIVCPMNCIEMKIRDTNLTKNLI